MLVRARRLLLLTVRRKYVQCAKLLVSTRKERRRTSWLSKWLTFCSKIYHVQYPASIALYILSPRKNDWILGKNWALYLSVLIMRCLKVCIVPRRERTVTGATV